MHTHWSGKVLIHILEEDSRVSTYLIGARSTCFQTHVFVPSERYAHTIRLHVGDTTKAQQINLYRTEILVEAFDVYGGDVANLHIAYNILYDMIRVGDIWGTSTEN